MLRPRRSNFWRKIRREAGDTLIEVTMALSILSMVLISSTVIAAQAFRLGQTARERTTVSTAAQAQLEAVRAFRDNNTWDHFLHGNGSTYPGVLNAAVSTSTCLDTSKPCMHMAAGIGNSTFIPFDASMASVVPTSHIDIVAVQGSTPDEVIVTVNYWFDTLGRGKATGHIKTSFSNLTAGPAPTPTPIVLPPACGIQATDIVLDLDFSTSMGQTFGSGTIKMNALKSFTDSFINSVLGASLSHRIAIVRFGSTYLDKMDFSSNASQLTSYVDSSGYDPQTGTQFSGALNVTKQLMLTKSTNPARMVVFVTDGELNTSGLGTDTPAIAEAAASVVKNPANAAELYTVGIGNMSSSGKSVLTAMATDPSHFTNASDSNALGNIINSIASSLNCP